MLKHFLVFLIVVAIISTFGVAQIKGVLASDKQVKEQQKMQELGRKLQLSIDKIKDSPVPSLVELHTNRSLFYATKDGNYFLQARIFNIKDAIIDETENTS